MEQRRLRLGDILDDYCPRERRVTNHAVVAMIEDDIKQTRCTTCDAEHAYKGGRAPKRRKKETPAALYKDVLAGMPEPDTAPVPEPATISEEEADLAEEHDDTPATFANENIPEERETPPAAEDGPVHRPLIRATLPRPEGQKTERPLPEFTIRQPGTRANGSFRGGDARMKMRGHGNGNRPHGGGRFGGGRPGAPGRPGGGRGGPSGGFRSGQPRHGGKKRSR